MARTCVDLFSGIGGFSLAAHANGVRTVAFCEIDVNCRAFLAKAWPGVDIHDDVRTFDAVRYAGAWLVTGGVPCQPASRAGKQRGKADDRWLWEDAVRVISEIRPAWALLENPPGIGDVGLAGVLSDLAGAGYETGVVSIPACAVGAPHRRERYWIIGHLRDMGQSERDGREAGQPSAETAGYGRAIESDVSFDDMADTGRLGRGQDLAQRGATGRDADGGAGARNMGVGLADAHQSGSQGRDADAGTNGLRAEHRSGDFLGDPDAGGRHGRAGQQWARRRGKLADAGGGHWSNAVYVPCADGKFRRAPGYAVSLVNGLHRSILGALGNSIVPQVAAEIIAAMIAAED